MLEKCDCTKKITQAKNDYSNKLTDKLQNPTAPRTYWAILSRLLYNKKIPAISPLLADGKFVSDFCEKEIIFNIFFINMYTNTKYKYFTTYFYIGQIPEQLNFILLKRIYY